MRKRLLLGFFCLCVALSLFAADNAQEVQAEGGIVTNVEGLILDDPADFSSEWDFEDASIKKIMEYLDLGDSPDWIKVLRIHDFTCQFIEYDYDNLAIGNLEQTFYLTLTTGKTMCSGYSQFASYLLQEAGVDCKTISCQALDHAWNVVNLYGQWYNMDTTWDDNTDGTYGYDNFLQCDKSFGHGRGQLDDREYDGYDGLTIAPQDFYCGNFGEDLYWVISEDKVLTCYGDGEKITEGYMNVYPFTSAVLSEGITTIGGKYSDSAPGFRYCDGMTQISLPVSLTYIGTDCFLDCNHLTDVYYAGSEAQWKQIEVLSGNEDLLNARIHFAVASEEGETLSGTCGEDLTWTLAADKVLRIDGNGDMYDYGAGEAPWHAYADGIFDIVIEEGVTGIGAYAFDGCSRVLGVTVPASVKALGDYAFTNCTGLRSFVIPDTVSSVGKGVFYGCSKLQKVTLPVGIKKLPDKLFYNCELLYQVALPAGVEAIGDYCFYNSAIYSMELPESLTKIGAYAFAYCHMSEIITSPNITEIAAGTYYGCQYIKQLEIPDYITGIGESAFTGCDEITTLVFPGTPIALGTNAFSGCDMLTTIDLKGVTSIGDGCFMSCPILEEIEIPDSVVSIGADAFTSCRDLETVTIAGSVKTIGDRAFQKCHNLTSVTLEEGLLSIGESAFSYCTDLKTLILPDSITSIGTYAFENCRVLEKIDLPANLTKLGDGVFYGTVIKSITVPGGIKNLGDGAFAGCSELETVILKEGVVSIGVNAFGQCGSLSYVEIPTTVTEIGRSAFSYCSKLKRISIPAGVTTIESYTFQGCGLTDVCYGGTVAQWQQLNIGSQNGKLTNATIHYSEALEGNDGICNNALTTFWYITPDDELVIYGNGEVVTRGWSSYADQIKSITIMPGITSVSGGVFSTMKSLTTVRIPDSATAIDGFQFCTALTSIVLPDSVKSLGDFAFMGCSSLTDVTLPSGLTALPAGTFVSCSYLYNVTLPEGLTSIGNDAFSYCTALTDIVIPAGVTEIAPSAFFGCSGLRQIEIPAGVTTIGEDAFCGCTALESIVLPASVSKISAGAFSDCNGLEQVLYAGSVQQKKGMVIDYWNDLLTDAAWSYGSCTTTKLHTYDDCSDTACNVCGNVREETHAYQWVIDEFFCTSGGKQHEECTVCHAVRNENTVVPAVLQHNYEWIIIKDANGCMAGVKRCECTVCHTVMYDNVAIPATDDHTFTDADDSVCNVCLKEFIVVTFVIDAETVVTTRNAGNKPINMPGSIPDRDGYRLVGWSPIEGGATELWAMGTYYVPQSTTFYALWEKLCPECEGSCRGIYDCLLCSGSGSMADGRVCYRCAGTGKNTWECAVCWGSGVMERAYSSAPAAPEVQRADAHTVVLKTLENGEYSLDGIHWQDSPVFENLVAGKTYTFYQRYGQTDEILTSEMSKPLVYIPHDHSYDGDTCTVCGAVRTLVSIALTTKPDKTVYYAGDAFSAAGGKVTAYYNDGSFSIIDLTEDMVWSYNSYMVGVQSLTVYYNGTTTTLEIEVTEKTVVSISVTSKPSKQIYLEGEALDLTGMVITANYNNGIGRVVGGYSISGYSITPGTKTITITYEGKTASFTVTVEAKTVASISVTTKPNKLTYLEGDAFDKTGMVVTVYYNNQTSAVVKDYTVSGYTATAGTKTITVTYGGKTATFMVTVKSRVPSAITSSKYTVRGTTIRKIAAGTAVRTLLSGLNEEIYCRVYNGNTEAAAKEIIATGMTVKLMDGNAVKASYTAVVTGDVNGDGKITITDMLAVKAHILKKSTLAGAYAQAADTSNDGGISITDFIQIKASILNKGDIVPN